MTASNKTISRIIDMMAEGVIKKRSTGVTNAEELYKAVDEVRERVRHTPEVIGFKMGSQVIAGQAIVNAVIANDTISMKQAAIIGLIVALANDLDAALVGSSHTQVLARTNPEITRRILEAKNSNLHTELLARLPSVAERAEVIDGKTPFSVPTKSLILHFMDTNLTCTSAAEHTQSLEVKKTLKMQNH